MVRLKFISTLLVILGLVLSVGAIVLSMRELMELGFSIGVAGVIGYAVMFILSSTSIRRQKSHLE